jgi:hypothetical protein
MVLFSIEFYLAPISVGAWKNKRLKYGHQVRRVLTEAPQRKNWNGAFQHWVLFSSNFCWSVEK